MTFISFRRHIRKLNFLQFMVTETLPGVTKILPVVTQMLRGVTLDFQKINEIWKELKKMKKMGQISAF
jgi:hypothetical protein